jgi:DNA-binding FadR family transcriptional regulator
MDALVAKLREQLTEPLEQASDTDLAFHIQVARATQNPLFPLLIEVLSGFVAYATVFNCRDDPVRRERAVLAHEAIVEAIREQDADRARAEMEAHVRYSMHYVMQSGRFESPRQQEAIGAPTADKDAVVAEF